MASCILTSLIQTVSVSESQEEELTEDMNSSEILSFLRITIIPPAKIYIYPDIKIEIPGYFADIFHHLSQSDPTRRFSTLILSSLNESQRSFLQELLKVHKISL